MRRSLRTMIDNGGVQAASPAAQHVAKHIADPVGSTKDAFDDLNEKQLQYEMAKAGVRRQFAPVKSVIDQVEQTHNLNPDEEMGYDPNMQNGPGVPGLPQMPPPNTNAMPGRMQQNNPAGNVSMPGTGPRLMPGKGSPTGPTSQAFPPKMGAEFPGKMGQAAYPSGTQQRPGAAQVNPDAARPKGAGKLGRGSASKNNKDVDKKAGRVNVTVHADSAPLRRNQGYFASRESALMPARKPFSNRAKKS